MQLTIKPGVTVRRTTNGLRYLVIKLNKKTKSARVIRIGSSAEFEAPIAELVIEALLSPSELEGMDRLAKLTTEQEATAKAEHEAKQAERKRIEEARDAEITQSWIDAQPTILKTHNMFGGGALITLGITGKQWSLKQDKMVDRQITVDIYSDNGHPTINWPSIGSSELAVTDAFRRLLTLALETAQGA